MSTSDMIGLWVISPTPAGVIPAELGGLHALTYLYLSNNQLSGEPIFLSEHEYTFPPPRPARPLDVVLVVAVQDPSLLPLPPPSSLFLASCLELLSDGSSDPSPLHHPSFPFLALALSLCQPPSF